MTPPLTRETLAGLRKLRRKEYLAHEMYVGAVADREPTARWFDEWKEARHRLSDAMLAASDSLLAAAERGLDAEGGR